MCGSCVASPTTKPAVLFYSQEITILRMLDEKSVEDRSLKR
jgi:hypothetical protein